MKEHFQLSLMHKKETFKLEKINSKTKESIFNLMHILLKQHDIDIWVQRIIIAIQIIQLLAFSLSSIVIKY